MAHDRIKLRASRLHEERFDGLVANGDIPAATAVQRLRRRLEHELPKGGIEREPIDAEREIQMAVRVMYLDLLEHGESRRVAVVTLGGFRARPRDSTIL